MLRKCKQCNWLTANVTYSLCHACGGELQEYELPELKIRPTLLALDFAVSPAVQHDPNNKACGCPVCFRKYRKASKA